MSTEKILQSRRLWLIPIAIIVVPFSFDFWGIPPTGMTNCVVWRAERTITDQWRAWRKLICY